MNSCTLTVRRLLTGVFLVALFGVVPPAFADNSLSTEARASLETALSLQFATLPGDIRDLISRAENCQSYLYTAPDYITKKMKCYRLDADFQRQESKHEKNASVLEALKHARQLYL